MKAENDKILSIKNLTMNYGSKNILNGINLEVTKGQIIGYIGPNGAGKSTTVKIMLGLIDDYQGEVVIFGQDISSGDPFYKRRIGYVPENAEAYDNLTAMEYLVFTGELYGMDRDATQAKAERLMQQFDLRDVGHSRLSSFSKGMKQKVLIIASLLHDPDLLFWDEPLSGLDANSMMVIQEILAQLAAQGKTIFYSSHIMDLVEKISNRIVLLVKGEVVADGTFEELQEMSQEGSLSGIFNQLTGFTEHRSKAQDFVSIVQGDKEYA
ncbi:ABC transporter-like protein [Planococcus antarcticus DSM 14505]|uniref:ABC transporter n=1 Tax=Planococcus antarcticus DSM 14505 TaxID=1185653 RepID=A0A1C7DK34_9BACL|nr:ABC transporter ATP-binding protein [Planococcus antarcticus]ANU11949.1 ABC transporter [Planococcus antarcticus DSM 14505]EIM05961.1 ABC transporter-like protein [Planococcus antarcticus DSM 14505]